MEQQSQLLHFCDSKHRLVYRPDYRGGATCYGCQESVYGPSYYCNKFGCPDYWHHKSCAELPLGLHHPLHPLHPLILFDEKTGYLEKENSSCKSIKNLALNTLIVVTVVTSTFTPNALFCNLKLNSMITHTR